MRAAHHTTCQSCAALALVATLVGCATEELAPTTWPPADFRIEYEELAARDGRVVPVRRFAVDASGLAVYATATGVVVDAAGAPGAEQPANPPPPLVLPVYDRVCAYQLVPECVRALARKLHRLGIGTLDAGPADCRAGTAPGARLRWCAFTDKRELGVATDVEWALGEILYVLAAHLPPGEPPLVGCDPARKVEAVLQGVPTPVLGAGATDFWWQRAVAKVDDDALWAAAFACAVADGMGNGEITSGRGAKDVLQRWRAARQGRPLAAPWSDEALERMVPLTFLW
ncbi:MAG: hypothetical protein FJ301_13440 [Planctomycetes bacterium]|nr:hypothetical protein [Planctomycetota bacterium]